MTVNDEGVKPIAPDKSSQRNEKAAQVAIIVAILGLIGTLAGAVFSSPVILAILEKNDTPEISASASPNPCPYQGNDDEESITNLIMAEAQAANEENMQIIQQIFRGDATITDAVTNETWANPISRYRDTLYAAVDFSEVNHFDILPAAIYENTAYFTSGSRGKYRPQGGDWQEFFNASKISSPKTEYGSDHWVLEKNNSGCWQITHFEFNAGPIRFP